MTTASSRDPRPAVSSPRPWRFPIPRRVHLANGLTFLVYDMPGQHVISVRVAVPIPLGSEPIDREGVGTLMARTLDEGTAAHSADEMTELLERKGVALGAGVGESGLIVDLDVPRRQLEDALDLLRQILTEPAFGEHEIRRHVRTRLAEIELDLAQPGQRAAIEFAATYYDPSDRRSRPTSGSRETVSAITAADVAAYHAATVGPDGTTIVAAGDFGDLDVDELLERTFGGWKGASSGQKASPPVPAAPVGSGRIVIVDRPDSVQTELYVGCPGPSRDVEGGWAPYPVLSFLVGGSPNARLDAVLREEKGFTYGIRCLFRPRRGDGLFIASGSVRTEVTGEALGLLVDILEKAREGFTAEETAGGVDYVSKTAPGRFATADAVADEAAARALDGLTTEHTTQTLQETVLLKPKALRTAYRQFVDGSWTVVAVGDASAIAEPIRALGRGEVTVVSD